MIPLPTLRQLHYLIALSETGSFGRAAAACHVTQSTLSAGIKDLEDVLQSPVIDRSSRKVLRFTPVGQDVLKQAPRILAQVEEMTYRAHRLHTPLAWPVKMGVIPTIAPYLLPRLLKPLQKKLPALDLHLHEKQSKDLVDDLIAGEIDLALMAFPFDLKGLAHHILMKEQFVCAAPDGFFKTKKPVRMADLVSERLLLLEDGHCLRDHAMEACHFLALKEAKTMRAASLSTLIQMVAQGYGITFLPDMAVREKGALPRGLSIRPFESNAPTRQIGLAWKKDGPRQQDVDLVIGGIKSVLSNRT